MLNFKNRLAVVLCLVLFSVAILVGWKAQPASIMPTGYETSQRWKEDIIKDEKFIVQADVDVLVPKLDSLSVEKVVRRNFTQENIDEFLVYFTGQETHFTGFPQPNRAKLETALVKLKKELMDADAAYSELIKADIEIVELTLKDLKNMTMQAQEPVDSNFTYLKDYATNKPYKKLGENYISIYFTNHKTNQPCGFYAGKYEEGKTEGNRLLYRAKNFELESSSEEEMKYVEQQEKNTGTPLSLEESFGKTRAITSLTLMQKNRIDQTAGLKKASSLLKEIGINDVEIIKTEKALLNSLDIFADRSFLLSDGHGLAFSFVKECGGLPAENEGNTTYYDEESKENDSTPPFHGEYGTLVLDANLEIAALEWNNPMLTIATTPSAALLPFEEISEKTVNHMYKRIMQNDIDFETASRLRYETTDVRLMSAYTPEPSDPNSALMVPAWRFTFQNYFVNNYPEPNPNGKELLGEVGEIWVNALDGSIITAPKQFIPSGNLYSIEYEPGETPEPTSTPAPGNED